MNSRWILTGEGRQIHRLTYRQGRGQPETTVSPILTVADVCHSLRKSRRQVYRYLRTGRLRPCARVLGQWLFAQTEMDRFAQTRLPRVLRTCFWDTPLSSLSVDHHRDFILARVLEVGDWRALDWIFRTYPRSVVRAFLKGRGADRLSARTWHFWAIQVGLKTAGRRVSWRIRGRSWGGVQ